MTGASNVKSPRAVPTTVDTVKPEVTAVPEPDPTDTVLHASAVVLVHALVAHATAFVVAVTVWSP